MYKNETIQRHSTDNTKHCTYNYTYYQDTHTIQNKLHTKWNSLNTVKFPQHKVTLRYMVLLSNSSWCLIAGIIIFKWQQNSVWVPTCHAIDDTKPWRLQNIPPIVRLLFTTVSISFSSTCEALSVDISLRNPHYCWLCITLLFRWSISLFGYNFLKVLENVGSREIGL